MQSDVIELDDAQRAVNYINANGDTSALTYAKLDADIARRTDYQCYVRSRRPTAYGNDFRIART